MVSAAFLTHVNQSVFGGRMSAEQSNGLRTIADYGVEKFPGLWAAPRAYVLATATWETGRRMKPVREAGGWLYLRRQPYWPYVGEGLIQVTWKANYAKFGAHAPGDLLQWPCALDALWRGMSAGLFTGKKLGDYFTQARSDFVNARRIVNGVDRAAEIAALAQSYLRALEA